MEWSIYSWWILKKLFSPLVLGVKNGSSAATLSLPNATLPIQQHKALWYQTRALTEDALILQPLITRVSLQRRADGRMGHKKDVPTINQTTGVTAHKIGELSSGSRCWRLPLCPQTTPPFFLLFGSQVKRMPHQAFCPPPCVFPLVFELGPRYELFPESVTGVIESALSSLSAKHWWMWSWMRFGF